MPVILQISANRPNVDVRLHEELPRVTGRKGERVAAVYFCISSRVKIDEKRGIVDELVIPLRSEDRSTSRET